MDPTEARLWIEIIAATVIPIAVGGVIAERIIKNRSPGVRTIQFIGISTIPPLVLILGLEGTLEKSAIGALFGALVGYLFANIGQYDKRKGQRDKRKDDGQDA